MKRKKLTILIIVFILLLSIAAGIFYVAKTVLPSVIREKIITGISSLTSSKVTVGDIKINLLKGIVISDLTIFDKENSSLELCSLKEASAVFFILPIIKNQKIIIPELRLKSLQLNLLHKKDNTFNISYLFNKKDAQTKENKKSPSILILATKLTDANISIVDETTAAPVSANLIIPKLTLHTGFKKLALETNAEITKDKQTIKSNLKAIYTYNPERLLINVSVDKINVSVAKEYIEKLPFNILTGELNAIKINCAIDDNSMIADANMDLSQASVGYNQVELKNASGSINILAKGRKDNLKAMTHEGKLNIASAAFGYDGVVKATGSIEKSNCNYSITPDGLNLSASVTATGINGQKDAISFKNAGLQTNVKLTIATNPKDNSKNNINYEGSASVKCNEVIGVPKVNKIQSVDAALSFKTNSFFLEQFNAKILNTDVTAKGKLVDNKLDVDAEGDFDLEILSELIKKNFASADFDISGTTEAKVHISQDLSKQEAASFTGEAELQNASLVIPKQKLSFETDKGTIKFNTAQETLSWRFSSVKYLVNNFGFTGNLNNFKTPSISGEISASDINIKAKTTIKDGAIQSLAAAGTYKNSTFDLNGEINSKQVLTISGQINLRLGDLKFILPNAKDNLDSMMLGGSCLIGIDANGPVSDYKLWNIDAKITSNVISIYGLKLNNLLANYSQSNSQGYINSLVFEAYDGKGEINGRINLANKDIGYALRASLKNININKAMLDTPLKDKKFGGILNADILINGLANNLNSMKGEGSLSIKDGNLWEFNPLRGLGDFLFIPRFTSITFTNAAGDFAIQDGYVSTENFEMTGSELGLLVEGKIGFKGELEFLVNTEVKLPGEGKAQKIGEAITTAGNLTAIKITGTVKEPKYTLQPIGENILKRVGEIFSNILP